MAYILGYNAFGNGSYFSPPVSNIYNVGYVEAENCIIDEISIRTNVEQNYITTTLWDYYLGQGTFSNVITSGNALVLGTSGSVYYSAGVRTSPIYQLSNYAILTSYQNSVIIWNSNVPVGTSANVMCNYSFDNGQTWNGWQTCNNGSELPDMAAYYGANLQDFQIQIQEQLSTSNSSMTPSIGPIRIWFQDNNIITIPKNSHDSWYDDTRMLAQFNNNLEAGNIYSNGLSFNQFAITRRRSSELNSILIKMVPFLNGQQMTYTDVTAGVDNYIYEVYPVGTNGIWGNPSSAEIYTGSFAGWWILDKENTTNVIEGDQYTDLNSEPDIQGQLNQTISVIDTFQQYPMVYKFGNKFYHSYTLNLILMGTNGISSFSIYNTLLSMANLGRPLVFKNGNGLLYFGQITDIKPKSHLASHRDTAGGIVRDFMYVDVTFVETISEADYHRNYT